MDFSKSLQKMFQENFHLTPNEKVVFITDFAPEDYLLNVPRSTCERINDRAKFVEKLSEFAKIVHPKDNVFFIKFPATLTSGKEIPFDIKEQVKQYDVFIAITTFSLSHTIARAEWTNKSRKKMRGASMPGFNLDMFDEGGPMDIAYKVMSDIGSDLIQKINSICGDTGGKIQILNDDGTDLTFLILKSKRKFKLDDGLYTTPGSWGNLPAGEIFIAPDEGTANGVISVDRKWSKRAAAEKMIVYIKEGLVTSIDGSSTEFHNLIFDSSIDHKLSITRKNIAEFGIGLNMNARFGETVLVNEKILNTCHIALGSNASFGGNIQSDIHIDLILPNPSIKCNNISIMENGRLIDE
jgi:aminopeptidase